MKNTLTFGIIGYGRFGKLWADCLQKFGDVKVFDKNLILKNIDIKDKKQSSEKIKKREIHFASLRDVTQSDLLFLLVPISEIENICKKIAPLLNVKTTVLDACSVKVLPAKAMKKWLPKAQPIIATHPLFGPDSVKRMGIKNQKIVVSKIRATSTQQKTFEKILKKLQLKIIHATPEQHDEQMAKSQALVHFIGRGLHSLNLNEQPIATPDYNTLLRMNEMVHNDTWQLFYDMQNYNPYTKKIRKNFLTSLQKLEYGITKKTKKRLK